MANFKKCYRCEDVQPLVDFCIDKSKNDGRSLYCYSCRRTAARLKRSTEKHKINRKKLYPRYKDYNRNYQLKARYGITLAQFEQMIENQGKKCLICETPKPDRVGFVVDHCHKTGKIRGILCNLCNVAIGSLREDFGLARKVAEYLEKSAQ